MASPLFQLLHELHIHCPHLAFQKNALCAFLTEIIIGGLKRSYEHIRLLGDLGAEAPGA